MFTLYSKGCEYTFRALVHAATEDGKGRFQAKDVCEKAGIPEPYTRKVFQSLVQGGLLIAARGPGGGYVLAEKPSDISLLRVIRAVDGEETFDACVMGLPQCDGKHPCPLHEVWAGAKERLLERLEKNTLQDLLDAAKTKPGQKPKRKRK
ncbi:MAG: Rrf2 family transcriptional regulator [Candidatus Hydrogenedentes bacterium]|nr:Rrf2 family transcriptional regulator [Candidatus Hydrogenedentota bacterium]